MKKIVFLLACLLLPSCSGAAMVVQIYGLSTTGVSVPLTGVASGSSYALLVTTSTSSVTGLDVWSQGKTVATSQVTVNAGAGSTSLLASSTTRRAVTFINTDTTNAVFLGNSSSVTTTTGFKLPAGASATFSFAAGSAWFAIQAAGGPVIDTLSESN